MSPDVLTRTGVIRDAAVTPQATPTNTVNVAPGNAMAANAAGDVGAVTLTIADAHATLDRMDVVVFNPATSSAVVLQGTPGDPGTVLPPDTTGYTPLAFIEVYSRQHPAYSGAITAEAIIDARNLLDPTAPANTMAYTWDSGSTASGDPGAGKFRSNSVSTFSAITHLYVSYTSPSWPFVTAKWSKLDEWFNPLVGSAYYLRVWSRQAPNKFALFQVAALTDNTTYADLTVVPVSRTLEDAGPVSGGPPWSTDPADCIFELWGAVAPAVYVPDWTVIRKTADTSRQSTTTPTDDPDLQFAMAAGKVYAVRGCIRWDTNNASASMKWTHNGPTSPTRVGIASLSNPEGGSTVGHSVWSSYGNTSTDASATGNLAGIILFDAIIENGVNAGTFAFQWSQGTSIATPLVVRRGSFIEYMVVV